MSYNYFTKLSYLTSLEDDLMSIHRVVRRSLDEEEFLSDFGTSKEFYEEDEEYRGLVDDFEKLEKNIEPEVVELINRVLVLRKRYIEENN